MKALFRYLNPISHLGDTSYSIFLPSILVLTSALILELVVYFLIKNPEAVGLPAIFIFIGLIIYSAFRMGMRGGLVATLLTVGYYFYIIKTQNYTGDRLVAGIETTLVLGVLYSIIALTIGWLKQTIDKLIQRETDEKMRLQAIIQQLPVGVIITDRNGYVEHTNKQIDDLLGLKIPTGFQMGTDTLTEGSINDQAIYPNQSPLAQALTTGKPIVGKEMKYTHKRKQPRYLKVSASPIHNKSKQIIAAASIISDISAEKLVEQRKDDFVNMVSHELKTPITSLKLYSGALVLRLAKEKDDRLKKIIQNIEGQTKRLEKLVNDLLDVSRLQTGKLTFEYTEFRLDDLIAETTEMIQETSPHHTLNVTAEPVRVRGDRFRIYQVLTNLITNAIKYSPRSDKVEVRLKRNKSQAVIEIEDFGIGIAKDQQQKIFQRLYQVEDEEEKTFPGFGMGLFIAKEIIDRHHGTIAVKSEKNKGSTFTVTLPLSQEKQRK